MTIDIKELRQLVQAATKGPWVSQGRYIGTPRHMSYIGEVRDQCGNWSDTEKSRSDAAYIAAANPATVSELLNRLEVEEKDIALKERIIDSLGSELNAVSNERDALRTELAVLRSSMTFRTSLIGRIEAERDALQAKVEATPYGTIGKILTEVMDIAVANGADSRSMPDEYVEVAAWLCGVPSAKGE